VNEIHVLDFYGSFIGFIGQALQSPHLSFRMTTIKKKLPKMNGQVSKVLEGMDKLNVKVESFMQQLLTCREDGVPSHVPNYVLVGEDMGHVKGWMIT
jgi:hypothetical protein